MQIKQKERDEIMLNRLKKINWKRANAAIVLILLIEIFVWNHSFWLTMNYNPIRVDEVYTETGIPLKMGSDYVIGNNSYLEIKNINREVENLHLNIWTYKETDRNVLTLMVNMIDSGSKDYYGVSKKVVSPLSLWRLEIIKADISI